MVVKILQRSTEHQAHAFDVSRGSGLLGIIAGLAALCGWSVLPAYVIRHLWFVSQVHPNAALGFILVGSPCGWRDTTAPRPGCTPPASSSGFPSAFWGCFRWQTFGST